MESKITKNLLRLDFILSLQYQSLKRYTLFNTNNQTCFNKYNKSMLCNKDIKNFDNHLFQSHEPRVLESKPYTHTNLA